MPMSPTGPEGLPLATSNPGDACLHISLGFIIRMTCLAILIKFPVSLVWL